MESGVMLSKEAIIRFFFSPLGCILIYDKMGILYSNQNDVFEYFVKNNISLNEERTLHKFSLRSKYTNPSTALFGFIDDIMLNVGVVADEKKQLSLTLFHFTNFGASPHTEIYKIPANLFEFYRICKNIKFENQWKRFIQAHYFKYNGHNPTYNSESNSYEEKVKEMSGVEKSFLEKLKTDESLDFDLCQFGYKVDSKTKKEYILFDTGELTNWKNGKIYKKWKEDNSNLSEDFSKSTNKFKESQTLVFKEEYFSFKWINIIYDKLIRGSTIRLQFLKWSEKNILDFKIIRIYQQIIIGMNTKTLDLIEKISDFVIQDISGLKKNISKIKTSNNSELRSFLIKQIETNYKNGSETPLITLREYVGYLFPEGTNWKEIRDLMLICIYQKLHENEIPIEIEEEENEENN
jgi:CRISPR-associated protein Cst1